MALSAAHGAKASSRSVQAVSFLPEVPVCRISLSGICPHRARGVELKKAGEVAQILGKVAIGLIVAANVITLAPCAKADENSFLANLGQHGIFTVRDPAVLVNFGRGICDDLANGVSIPDEVNRFQAKEFPTAPTTTQAQAFVDAAHQDLCPDAPG
ncbi:DUF732 domain-containing protein [Mycobacterium noviomagense]|uniref:DUF732 domain-containing protein n=1 Tax=Mycobacterium noviomagense TaxID=459858 RepID=UPI0009F1B7B8|nr:DUF732 domain-containing protein [Mycobacterium noviomagense]